jgi:signal transduction histidine kinase
VPATLPVRVRFGSAQLDLREAVLGPGTTTIDISVAFGSLELTVPPDLELDVAVSTLAGSVEDARKSLSPRVQGPDDGPYRAAPSPDTSRVRLVGTTKFGSCEIMALERGQTRRDLYRALRQARVREHFQQVHDAISHAHDMAHEARNAAAVERDARIDEREQRDRERFERRFERHRRRHHRHHERMRAWQHERELWMGEGRRWLPWWMQARMRRRIFWWFGVALAIGTFAGTRIASGHAPWWIIPGLIVLWAASGAVAWRLTRPLLMAVKAARDIGDGKLDTRVHARGGGEVQVLADAINEMASRIEQQIKDQRQLLAAVSHELRTPLGHMRVLIETARETKQAKPLDELEREVLVLDDLVGRLLASSRLEFGNLDRRPIDLGELVTDVATQAGLPPEAIEAIGDTHIAADPTLVRRAIANLVDNARVHGGGAVAVRIERRGDAIAVEVDDAGPGVPADRRADAFRAFVPSSGGGLGLGLALVARIAKAHGGTAYISDRPGGGARVGFTVT